MVRSGLKSMDLDTFLADSRRKKFALGHEWNAGAPCLKCGPVKCEGGLDLHYWRKNCKTCKCNPEEHDIKSAEEEAHKLVVHSLFSKDSPVGHIRDYFRKCEEAKNTQRSEYAKQFAWCPLGLQENVLRKYMDVLPPEVKPKVGSDGAKYRRKQMMYQLPIHDHDENYCDSLTEPERASMRQFCEKRNQNALGVGDVREKMNPVSEWVCCRCDNNINLGEVAVFTFHGGETKCWHPGCFMCQVCNNVLVDLIYFYKDGGIYCGRHYAEMFKPRCAACDELIFDGEYTQAMDKNWHKNHFCCFYCDAALSQQKFAKIDGKPACIECYDKNFASNCENCGKAISFGMKNVGVHGKHWHEECFVCSQPDCKRTLVSEEFSTKDDQLVCLHCSNDNASKVCETCGGDFDPREETLVYQGKTFHENCFTCDECKDPLGIQQFIRRDHKRLCGKCHDASYTKICVKCNEPIKSSVIEYDGNAYHSECFTCEMCSQLLAGIVFTTHAGNNICSDCYRDNYAKTCATCQRLIEGSTTTYDGKFFHRDCFTCDKCDQVLAEEKFFLVGDDKVCGSCISVTS